MDRRIDIGEDRSFAQMAKSIVVYLNTESDELYEKALKSIDAFETRDAQIAESYSAANQEANKTSSQLGIAVG